MQQAACGLYAFCREADDLIDEGSDPQAALNELHGRLDRIYEGNPLYLSTDRVLTQIVHSYQLPRALLDALLEGFEWDASGRSYPDIDAVYDYSARVAGAVGVMMSVLMGVRDAPTLARAADLGTAMQLTNIARDVLEDAHMGRRYLPATWVDGLSSGDIAKAAQTQDEAKIILVKQAVEKTINLAETYYQSGFAGLSYLPLRPRIAIAIAAKAYRQIGIQLRAHDLNWHEGRTVTSITNKAVQSIAALPKCLYLQPVIAHQATLHRPLEELFS